jgi:lycopene beta-cyclase
MPYRVTYDYIIAGMGCAGLSLAMQLKNSDLPFDKILLVDNDLKNKNDRTWCFWTKEKNNWFDKIIYKRWDKFSFKSKNFNNSYDLQPYQYLMIRGIDFYDYCLTELKKDARFHFITASITEIATVSSMGILRTNEHAFFAPYIFNSAFRVQSVKTRHVNYVQHFKGWLIETPGNCFDEDCPMFMNFDTEQHHDCRFFYVIPFSKNKALIEYTGFSKNSLSDPEYDQKLAAYIHNDLKIESFTIIETESGKIPMAESSYINPFGDSVVNIGTAGGYSKPSTGYTFYFIQKNTKIIVSQLKQKAKVLMPVKRKWDYELYDKILLDVLNKKEIEAREVFTLLFKKNKISGLLAFLNEESNIMQDLSILNSVPKKPFIISALKKLFS